ncbi:MAG: glycosyltransferase family 9 protein [Candidatus Omnitrophica bacterium]|nr:glycosyltransferase family 9 protein [Candidatus Omnitrophota bacterium]
MKKVLIANIFGVGDVLFTTPIIANLKEKYKDLKIDYMCNIRTMDIVNHVPGVNDIYIYEKDLFAGIWHESKTRFLKTAHNLFKDIREQKYDAVFDFTLSRELGLFFKLAGIPKRIGLDYKKRGIFLTDKVPFDGFKNKHVVEYYLDCLRHTGVKSSIKNMALFTDAISQERILSCLREKGIREDAGALIAIVPGGGASWGDNAGRKRWNIDGFADVADSLMEKGNSIAILGDVSESYLCRAVSGRMKGEPAMVVNNFTLPDYMAFLNCCDLVLCNDGGPVHIATALGVKTVSIFGPVDDNVYGPYPAGEDHIVMKNTDLGCRPCYDSFKLPECRNENRCLNDLMPEMVIKACFKLLG